MSKRKRPAKEKGREFDRRAMEATSATIGQLLKDKNFDSLEEANQFLMENLFTLNTGQIEYKPETPLDQAQSIMWEAFETNSHKKRISLANKAIKVCPDCADAYVLLAEEEARSNKEAIEYYRRGVEAGKRALGEKVWNDPEATAFWSDHSTRPYMRALAGLAATLNEEGDVEKAIEIWAELLRLNPDDNQGIRWILTPVLIAENRLSEAEKLLEQFDDDFTAHMYYSKAILLFKKSGDCSQAQAALEKAVKKNRHVISLLISLEELPEDTGQFTPGSPEEAASYLAASAKTWMEDESTLKWISEFIEKKLDKHALKKTFPSLTSDTTGSNVVNMNSFQRR